MQILIRVLFVLGLLDLTGCAFGTRHADLTYPPESDEGGGLIASAYAHAARPVESREILLKVSDHRTVTHRIGKVRNAYGMDTASVETEDNIQMWVQDAIDQELTNAGYKVTSYDNAGTNEKAIGLNAEILKVFCDAYMTYDGNVEMMVTLTKYNQKPFKRHYEGHGSAGMSFAMTSKSYAESVELALKDVIAQLLLDLAQYP